MIKYIIVIIYLFTHLICLAEAAPTIHLYNWADYMTDGVLEQFRAETGITVRQDYFASNEELLAKLQAGAFAYDVVVPSDYSVKILAARKLIRPLDHLLLPHRKHLEARFLDPPYDPGNRHSIPYFWGTTGIAFDRRKVGWPVRSWADLFDPRLKRKVNLLDDLREVIGAALRVQGHSVNDRDPAHLREAGAYLVERKERVRTFNSLTYREMLDAGDVWMTQGFSVDIARLAAENPSIGYVIPEEGGTLYTDNLVIPSAAREPRAAHRFIDFLLRPDVAAKLSAALRAATPNGSARKRLPAEIRDDPIVYAPPELLPKLEFVEDVGPSLSVYEDVWIDLKTR
jgi:spermidine/putrescine-binding protein